MVRRRLRAGALVAALAGALVLGGLARVARAEPEDLLYPPELVQKMGRQAGLSDEQLEKIRKDVLATRKQMIDVEAKLKHLHLEIEAVLGDDSVPAEQVVEKVGQVGAAETEMKKLQMGLLVRIRRGLTADQRRKLDDLRAKQPGPGMPGPGPQAGRYDGPPHPPEQPRPPEPPRPFPPDRPPAPPDREPR